MDLNIIRISIPINGKPLTNESSINYRYVGRHDIVDVMKDAQLYADSDARDVIRELSQRMGLLNASFEIIKLSTVSTTVSKSELHTRWSEFTEGDLEELKSFLNGNYPVDTWRAASSGLLTGEHMYYVSLTNKNKLKLIVSVPGYFGTSIDLDCNEYGFSALTVDVMGYGLSLYTVFTFTE
ncbi:hypothetical protein PHABIO_301 [Pseudomonas phage Phabio]|uniref:Uncharacterized protein n=1 Tax=Pseudomonas phage Phabio TaxID=2006668 RepID=A0A1Y0STW7_9CAUD|nr:hypothetical protein MZD05_gp301 [Pseudomonas phage Phabio]ARV76932.1 hypothetical protein PHABIO_301 [Pseudomonas phage Phabio]